MWSVLVLYNGKKGIRQDMIPGFGRVRSPVQFNPETGSWVFFSNSVNPSYVQRTVEERDDEETE